ncbi:hypothetical protein F2P81_024237 [Scophthalmus maximus]|uniref:Uncharacterized protein n=1 Tax=Scophthalmus maximus TaxID=52904 RepID=A0A6A4RTG3_SCOMX|nr:hypothetical protein F2P81_024237 [Scophthalmus maximus]
MPLRVDESISLRVFSAKFSLWEDISLADVRFGWLVHPHTVCATTLMNMDKQLKRPLEKFRSKVSALYKNKKNLTCIGGGAVGQQSGHLENL